jgi:hypothetical protein
MGLHTIWPTAHTETKNARLTKRGVTVLRIPAAELLRGADEAADAVVRLATELL